MPELTRPTVFLDRDGTINVKATEGDYITRPQDVRLLPGAAAAVRQINDAGALAIVVTNQRGIALGRMTEADLSDVHEELQRQLLDAAGGHIDAFFHCPHELGVCDCRKPGIGLLRAASESVDGVDPTRAMMVGDSTSDVEAGTRFGIGSVQLGVDASNLEAAVERALASLDLIKRPSPSGQPV